MWSYLLTYLLTPWTRVLPETLTCLQLVKIFPAFYVTRRFITVFTSAPQLSLSWASSIHPIPPPHLTSCRAILILSSYLGLGLPSFLLPSGFPTKTLYTPILSPIRATCSAHRILLDFITQTILVELYRSLSSSLCSFLHSLLSRPSMAQIFSWTPYSQTQVWSVVSIYSAILTTWLSTIRGLTRMKLSLCRKNDYTLLRHGLKIILWMKSVEKICNLSKYFFNLWDSCEFPDCYLYLCLNMDEFTRSLCYAS